MATEEHIAFEYSAETRRALIQEPKGRIREHQRLRGKGSALNGNRISRV
jgi:hypothetical protein